MSPRDGGGRPLCTLDDVHRYQGRLWALGRHRLDYPVRYVALGGFFALTAVLWPLFSLPGAAPVAYALVGLAARLATVTDSWPLDRKSAALFVGGGLLFWLVSTGATMTLPWHGMALPVAAVAAGPMNLFLVDRLGERSPRGYAELLAREGLTWLRHRREHAHRPLPSLITLRSATIRELAPRSTGDR